MENVPKRRDEKLLISLYRSEMKLMTGREWTVTKEGSVARCRGGILQGYVQPCCICNQTPPTGNGHRAYVRTRTRTVRCITELCNSVWARSRRDYAGNAGGDFYGVVFVLSAINVATFSSLGWKKFQFGIVPFRSSGRWTRFDVGNSYVH